MKKWLFAGILLIFCACGPSKKNPGTAEKDPVLEHRLAEFLNLYEDLNLEKMMDYIYPKMFTLVPRDQFLKNMTGMIKPGEAKVAIDSLKIDILHPVFEMDSARYAKAICSMVLILEDSELIDTVTNFTPHDTTHLVTARNYPAPRATLMQALLNNKYGPGNATIDRIKGIIRIRAKNQVIAIKDKFAPDWFFVTVTDDQPLPANLFSKAVLGKLAMYK